MEVSNPIVELRSTKMWIHLNEIDPKLATQSINFLEAISPLMASIHEFFPYYTRHDAHHGYRVLLRIEQIITEECLDINSEIGLTAQEAFLLICSAYAHDLGMTVFPHEVDNIRREFKLDQKVDWKTDHSLQTHLRRNHSTRGGQYIDQNAEEIGVPRNLVFPLNELMKSHNLSIHQLDMELNGRFAAGEREINLKQLACILCVADALEFSDTRVVEGVLNKIQNDSSEEALVSYRENMKHVCIGDSVAIGSDGRVIFSGSFNDPEILNLAHKAVDEIENWVLQYCDIDKLGGRGRLKLVPGSFIRNFKILNLDYERLGIRMRKENIINLISSNSLWTQDKGVAVRELIQNSVEACRYREFNTSQNRGYNPKITIRLDRDNRKITILDNGCGMSKNIILNNFLTVGNSRADDSTYSVHEYKSLARFGIGFWSVFTIASSVVVETAPFESLKPQDEVNSYIPGLRFTVSIEEFKDYTVFHPINCLAGTKIDLYLKENINLDEVILGIQQHLICCQIPLEITDGMQSNNFPLKVTSANYKDLFGSKSDYAKEKEVKVFSSSISRYEVDSVVDIAYREEKGEPVFLLNKGNSVLNILDDSFHKSGIGVCGFRVNHLRPVLCFDLNRVGRFSANVTNPEGFIFNLNRNSLVPSDRQEQYSKEIAHLIHLSYKKFLEDRGVYTARNIYNLNMQSRMHGGNVYDIYTERDLGEMAENFSDLICFKLYKIENGKEIEEAKVSYVNLEQLLQMSATIYSCQHSIKYTLEDKQLSSIYYSIIAQQVNLNQNTYLIDPCIEGSMLFDNDREAKVSFGAVDMPPGSITLAAIEINTDSLSLVDDHSWIIGKVAGKWSGTIYEREIKSVRTNFVFLGRYRLVIKKNTLLSNDLRNLYTSGKLLQVIDLILLLKHAEDGFIDERVRKYLI